MTIPPSEMAALASTIAQELRSGFTLARWLRLRQAALYSAIGEKRLVDLARSGSVRGFQDPDSKRGDWVFDRLSLDAYREAQAVCPTSREKAVAIMKGVRL